MVLWKAPKINLESLPLWQQAFYDFEDEGLRLMKACGFQEELSGSNLRRAKALAHFLVNERGELMVSRISEAIDFLETAQFTPFAGREIEVLRQQHMLKVLFWLREKEVQQRVEKIHLPSHHSFLSKVVALSACLPGEVPKKGTQINERDLRVAIVSAWLTYLRQNVGSCFATAPAIIIHGFQPDYFLQDMKQLLEEGQLKRTYQGQEYSVPAAHSFGSGELGKSMTFSKELSTSPSLLVALEAVGFVEKEADTLEKRQQLQALLVAFAEKTGLSYGEALTSERLLAGLIFAHLGLDVQEVEDFKKRPKPLITGDLMIGVGGGGLARFEQALDLLEQAKEAFLSLTQHPLLKVWEFSLASFSETKAKFCRWNILNSIGIDPDQESSVARLVYQEVQGLLNESNEEVEDFQSKYDHVFLQLNRINSKLRNAQNEQEAMWIRGEYHRLKGEEKHWLAQRDLAHKRAKQLANLYSFLIDEIDQRLGEYFQEVYDPDMRQEAEAIYDDTPAGFCLMFKAGRTLSQSWIPIKNAQQFIDALAQFFNAIEQGLMNDENVDEIQVELGQLITKLVQYIRSDEFLFSSLERLALASNKPYKKVARHEVEKLETKPWAFVSGGTMEALLTHYYNKDTPPTYKQGWFESVEDIWVFLRDCVAQSPAWLLEKFEKDENRPLLMHSPTHAFVMRPGLKRFKASWKSTVYPYTWIRDDYVKGAENFYASLRLSEDQQAFILSRLNQKTAQEGLESEIALVPRGALSPQQFREEVKKKGQASKAELAFLDASLYQCLPFTEQADLPYLFKELSSQLEQAQMNVPGLEAALSKSISSYTNETLPSSIPANWLQEALGAIFMEASKDFYVEPRSYLEALDILRFHKVLAPEPIVFADSNWTREDFAFLMNPGTLKLEFWQVERGIQKGFPMWMWSGFLDGSLKRNWGVYPDGSEYGLF